MGDDIGDHYSEMAPIADFEWDDMLLLRHRRFSLFELMEAAAFTGHGRHRR